MSLGSMRRVFVTAGVAAILAACTGMAIAPAPPVADTPELRTRLAQLESRIARLADINDIKRLQRAYGYYLDEGQWDHVADLFAADATLEIGKDGVFRGRDRIRQYFRTIGNGRIGLTPGRLNEHLQVMPVITLAGDSARGTWRDIILAGELGREAWWGEGPTEVRYVKQNGVWKIAGLHWFQTLYVPYEGGWAKNPDSNDGRFVGDRLRPASPAPSTKPAKSQTRTRSKTCSVFTASTWTRDCGARQPRCSPTTPNSRSRVAASSVGAHVSWSICAPWVPREPPQAGSMITCCCNR
jgi:hypothetical protein